jgi:hypothetical protein
MPLFVPENGDTYQLVANDKSLVKKGIHIILRQSTLTHLFHNFGAMLLHTIHDAERCILS